MNKKKIVIEVTEDDISQGMPRNPLGCALAVAIRRRGLVPGGGQVMVGRRYATVSDKQHKDYDWSHDGATLIDFLDRGGPKPDSFAVTFTSCRSYENE